MSATEQVNALSCIFQEQKYCCLKENLVIMGQEEYRYVNNTKLHQVSHVTLKRDSNATQGGRE